jgi:hypothetical protein
MTVACFILDHNTAVLCYHTSVVQFLLITR